MLDVVIRKSRHGIVRVIIVGLVADSDALVSCFEGRAFEILGQQLSLLVEVVTSALDIVVRILINIETRIEV